MTRKTRVGNFFEDFVVGKTIHHAVPRTVTEGDLALYIALTGDRRPLHCSREFARSLGFEREVVHDMLVFHIVFGRAVPDVSLNSPANLGYADVRFLSTVYPGDTLRAETEVIGKRETSRPDVGIVWVHTRGFNQREEPVLQFYRWAMVNKREPGVNSGADDARELPRQVAVENLHVPPVLDLARFDPEITASRFFWEDYEPGERILHPQGLTIEDAEHQMATRLYQNTARVHFNQFAMSKDRFGRRLIYGGHVISLARALSFNGLANAFHITAINGGRHVAPLFAGATVFAWTEVVARAELSGRTDVGALRLRTVATKDQPCAEFPLKQDAADHPAVILDLDYWVLMPR